MIPHLATIAAVLILTTGCAAADEPLASSAEPELDCSALIADLRSKAQTAHILIDSYFSVDVSDDSLVEEQQAYSELSAHMSTLNAPDIAVSLAECELHHPQDSLDTRAYLTIAFDTWGQIKQHCEEYMPVLAPQFDCS